ncbi:MAG: choice-of-anchor J domain-containing protein [Bacteroidales bacterium]|nr:choice-of-anchor J domain-containing protein [Bacteroidales bacterium]
MAKKILSFVAAIMAVCGMLMAQDYQYQPIPAMQSFEDGLQGWTTNSSVVNPTMIGAKSGSHFIKLAKGDYNASNARWLMTSLLALPNDDTVTVSFWAKVSSNAVQLRVIAAQTESTDISAFSGGDTLLTVRVNSTDYVQYSVSLNQHVGDTVRLAFVANIESNYYSFLSIDDVEFMTDLAPYIVIEGNNYTRVGQPLHLAAQMRSGRTDGGYQYIWEDGLLHLALQDDPQILGRASDSIIITWSEGGYDTVVLTTMTGYGDCVSRLPVRVYDCSTIDVFPDIETFEDGRLNCWNSPSNAWYFAYLRYSDNGDYYSSYNHITGAVCSVCDTGTTTSHWLTSPKVSVESIDMELSFESTIKQNHYAYNNRDVVYKVYVSNRTDSYSDFTEVGTYTYSIDRNGNEVPVAHRINLGREYVGNEVYVAFRNVSNNHYSDTLFLDNIRFGAPLPPDVKLTLEESENTTFFVGDEVVFVKTVLSTIPFNTQWNFGPNATVTLSGDSATVVWNSGATGYRQYSITVTDSLGQTVTLTDSIYVYNCALATTYPVVEDFEGRPSQDGYSRELQGCWNFVGNTGYNRWQIVSMDGNNVANIYASSAVNLVGPGFVIPTNTDVEFSWRTSRGDVYSTPARLDYCVMVSTTGNSSTDLFTDTVGVFSEVFPVSSMDTWYKNALNLNQYAGDTIYLAFFFKRTTSGNSYIYIDDIRVGSPTAPDATVEVPATAYTGRRVTLRANARSSVPLTSHSWSIEGATVLSSNDSTAVVIWDSVGSGSSSYTYICCNLAGCDTVTGTIVLYDCSEPVTEFPYTVDFNLRSVDRCWNGDGWERSSSSSSVYMESRAADGADYADNTLTGRSLIFPDESGYEIEWTVKGFNNPHYAVMVDDGTTIDTIFSENISANAWTTRRAMLPHTAGQPINIAFRHTGGGILSLQSLVVHAATPSTVLLVAPFEARTGQSITLKADVSSSDTNLTYTWTLPSATPATAATQTVSATWNTAGTYTVGVQVVGSAGTATDSMTITVSDCPAGIINDYPYSESFDNGLACWSTIDADGDGHSWESMRARLDYCQNSTPVTNYTLNSSDDAAVSWSRQPMRNQDTINLNAHNLLVTPPIALPGDSPLQIKFHARTVEFLQGSDQTLTVKLSTMGPSMSQFTNVLMSGTRISSETYAARTISLERYAGSTVYIAFEHHGTGGGGLLIDGVRVEPLGSSGIDEVGDVSASVSPNPVIDVLEVQAEDLRRIELLDVSGRTVATQDNGNNVNVGTLPAGVYMVRIVTGNGVAVRRVVKQ